MILDHDAQSISCMELDFSMSSQTVELSDGQVRRAIEFSQTAIPEAQKWSVYLQGLALLGFEQWLLNQVQPLELSLGQCSLLQPGYANLLTSVCNVWVGEFKVCLLTGGSFTDTQIFIPRAAIEVPDFVPHIYVLIEVGEEAAIVEVKGCLRSDWLLQMYRLQPFQPMPDWSYAIPSQWFWDTPRDLCLWLQCLKPWAIPSLQLDTILATSQDIALQQRQIQQQIQQYSSQSFSQQFGLLDPGDQGQIVSHRGSSSMVNPVPLWQLLDWEAGHVLFTQPELASWVYDLQHQSQTDQPGFNVRSWLAGELDSLAAQLSWVLLPPLSTAFRKTQDEDFQAILDEFQHRNKPLPSRARAAYYDFSLSTPFDRTETALRTYAIVWDGIPPKNDAEWFLLLLVGPCPGRKSDQVDQGFSITVRDDTQMLVEQSYDAELNDAYVYVCVAGFWNERFWVTIALNHNLATSTRVQLPPFRFK